MAYPGMGAGGTGIAGQRRPNGVVHLTIYGERRKPVGIGSEGAKARCANQIACRLVEEM